MNSIAKDQNNLGGVAKIWLIPSNLISSDLYETPLQTVTLPSGWENDSWSLIPVFQSASFVIEQKQSNSGTYWECIVTFKIPKVSSNVLTFTEIAATLKWSVILLDENGQYHLIGSDNYPLRAITKLTTGTDLAELNHIQVTLSGKAPKPPLIMNSMV